MIRNQSRYFLFILPSFIHSLSFYSDRILLLISIIKFILLSLKLLSRILLHLWLHAMFMMEQGICRPSKPPWSSPLHVVPKSSSSIHPVGDYRLLNSHTIPDRYPIPHIQDFSNALFGCKFFSKISIVRACLS